VPWIVFDVLKISSDLRTETLYSFYLLVLSLPIVTTSASVRGILEAYQEFRTINVIRTILGISGFVMPLLCMIFTKSLFWIVLSLVILRIVLWMMYFYKSFKVNPALKSVGMFDRSLLKPIFRLSSWMSVSSIIVPLNIYLDRFMIGAAISASAIALYTTPYELVSKLLIIPSAFAGVMFPAISATYINDPDYSKTLLIRASKYIFLILYPIVFLIIAFAPEGMAWWVGEPFAKNSYIVLQILAIGILFNSLGYIPYAFIDGIGRPDVNAKIQIIELPFYFFLLWLGIAKGGITGAAIVWSFRTAIDSVVLWFCSKKINPVPNAKIIEPSLTWGVPFIILPIVMILIGVTLSMKILVTVIILSIFMVITWHSLLEKEERELMFSKLISFTQGRGTNNATKS
jgi:O-antigen/teichoic acid export membrane protein